MAQNRQVNVDVTTEDEQATETLDLNIEEPRNQEQAADESTEEGQPDNPIKLRFPILINGVKRREFRWTDEITVEQYEDANSLAHGKRSCLTTAELDPMLHLWLGAMMIVAANPEVDPKDLEQIKGKDIVKLMRVGRFFMISESDED